MWNPSPLHEGTRNWDSYVWKQDGGLEAIWKVFSWIVTETDKSIRTTRTQMHAHDFEYLVDGLVRKAKPRQDNLVTLLGISVGRNLAFRRGINKFSRLGNKSNFALLYGDAFFF